VFVAARHLDDKVRVLHGAVSCASMHWLLKNAFDAETSRLERQRPDFRDLLEDRKLAVRHRPRGEPDPSAGVGTMEGHASLRTDDGWNLWERVVWPRRLVLQPIKCSRAACYSAWKPAASCRLAFSLARGEQAPAATEARRPNSSGTG
jgi:hypothetical protein